ncbi:TraB/GumN family protein [Parerythrobacter aestuarii]|uniref:TraB/GumN family protein n=1 Tax=Parerythrobacter aestuarii TaxID=3020909 RepID=UPI0024DE0AFB|nr:TraB/GumN family protein [Parerythrobacter aestuarii]
MNPLKSSLTAAVAALALLISPAAMAQVPIDASEMVAPAPTGPALWKVADEDTTIYLFGTVHVLPDGVKWMTPEIDTALDSSDMLVTEILMSPETTVRTQQLVAELGMLPAGTTLRSLLSEEQRLKYEAAMLSLGMPPAAFDPYEPWFATLNLSLLPLIKHGYQIDQGVEKVLEATADSRLERGALETIEFQMSIFDGAPIEAQIAYLEQIVDGVDEVKTMVDAMVAEWVEGDPDGLGAIMNEGMAETPELAEAVLYSRNANWAVWIDERLDQPGTVFVAVGAGHLAGERSVQDLLAQRGITVTRVQ